MSVKIKAKHNTTRSGSTRDHRNKAEHTQRNRALDPTGANNPISALSSNKDRGQTLGSGPWAQKNSLGNNALNVEKFKQADYDHQG